MTAPITLTVTSDYGVLSRGRHSARTGSGSKVIWAGKDSRGNLVITSAGQWQLHCADGFKRSARATLTVAEDGSWEMTGDTKRFDVL